MFFYQSSKYSWLCRHLAAKSEHDRSGSCGSFSIMPHWRRQCSRKRTVPIRHLKKRSDSVFSCLRRLEMREVSSWIAKYSYPCVVRRRINSRSNAASLCKYRSVRLRGYIRRQQCFRCWKQLDCRLTYAVPPNASAFPSALGCR